MSDTDHKMADAPPLPAPTTQPADRSAWLGRVRKLTKLAIADAKKAQLRKHAAYVREYIDRHALFAAEDLKEARAKSTADATLITRLEQSVEYWRRRADREFVTAIDEVDEKVLSRIEGDTISPDEAAENDAEVSPNDVISTDKGADPSSSPGRTAIESEDDDDASGQYFRNTADSDDDDDDEENKHQSDVIVPRLLRSMSLEDVEEKLSHGIHLLGSTCAADFESAFDRTAPVWNRVAAIRKLEVVVEYCLEKILVLIVSPIERGVEEMKAMKDKMAMIDDDDDEEEDAEKAAEKAMDIAVASVAEVALNEQPSASASASASPSSVARRLSQVKGMSDVPPEALRISYARFQSGRSLRDAAFAELKLFPILAPVPAFATLYTEYVYVCKLARQLSNETSFVLDDLALVVNASVPSLFDDDDSMTHRLRELARRTYFKPTLAKASADMIFPRLDACFRKKDWSDFDEDENNKRVYSMSDDLMSPLHTIECTLRAVLECRFLRKLAIAADLCLLTAQRRLLLPVDKDGVGLTSRSVLDVEPKGPARTLVDLLEDHIPAMHAADSLRNLGHWLGPDHTTILKKLIPASVYSGENVVMLCLIQCERLRKSAETDGVETLNPLMPLEAVEARLRVKRQAYVAMEKPDWKEKNEHLLRSQLSHRFVPRVLGAKPAGDVKWLDTVTRESLAFTLYDEIAPLQSHVMRLFRYAKNGCIETEEDLKQLKVEFSTVLPRVLHFDLSTVQTGTVRSSSGVAYGPIDRFETRLKNNRAAELLREATNENAREKAFEEAARRARAIADISLRENALRASGRAADEKYSISIAKNKVEAWNTQRQKDVALDMAVNRDLRLARGDAASAIPRYVKLQQLSERRKRVRVRNAKRKSRSIISSTEEQDEDEDRVTWRRVKRRRTAADAAAEAELNDASDIDMDLGD